MKTLKCVLVLFAFVGLLLLGCSDKTQSPVAPIDQSIQDQSSLEKCIITDFTVSLHYPVQIIDPGTVKLVRGKWIIKKVVVLERMTTTNSLVTGNMTHSLSAILDNNTGTGPVWGTFKIAPDVNTNGGVWKGTYMGWYGGGEGYIKSH